LFCMSNIAMRKMPTTADSIVHVYIWKNITAMIKAEKTMML
jgi:hypothetical protein